jgi:antitoxin CptB
MQPPHAREPGAAAELRRIRMRSWRRGTREMDLILGRFADAALHRLDPQALAAFDGLLSENDHDLFRWIARQDSIPDKHRSIIRLIRSHHRMD